MRGEWGDSVKAMVARLREIGPAKEGFDLGPGRKVIDPEKFHNALLEEAGSGPGKVRSVIGSFQLELELYLKARETQTNL